MIEFRPEGPIPCKLMLIGEALGENEELEGKPFVGRAGQVLNAILSEVGLERDQCYITNVCFDQCTKVLMADLSWRYINEVTVGEKVLAFDEFGTTRGPNPRRWRIATITATQKRRSKCVDLITKEGSLRLTPDHKILVSAARRNVSYRWIKAGNARYYNQPSHLVYIFGPEECPNELDYDLGWLAGFLDGEGTLSSGNTVKGDSWRVSASQVENGLLDTFIELCSAYGFKASKRLNRPARGTEQDCYRATILGGFAEQMRFLFCVRPKRLTKKLLNILETKPPVFRCRRTAKVEAKYSYNYEQDVYDITTTTGTFIANGFAVHNCWTRPPNNNFNHFYQKINKKTQPTPELLQSYERLKLEITQVQPHVIVPLGNEAMKAVLGFGGVLNYRGSILTSPYGKVIPTIHPASVARNWQARAMVVCDFQRIKEESQYPESRLSTRNLHVTYDFNEALLYLDKVKEAKYVSFDIETESDQITCIAFGLEGNKACSIPFWFGSSGSLFCQAEEHILWQKIKHILESPDILKVAHNGSYDMAVLRDTFGIHTQGYWLDTMLAGHTLYLELPKGLDFYTSIYTDQPYYKDRRVTDQMDELFRYNALDSNVTYEIAFKMEEELKEAGLWDFYNKYLHQLIYPLMDMEQRGVKFDATKAKELKVKLKEEVIRKQAQLEHIVGHKLNTASHKQMCEWLYEELRLPKQEKRNKATGKVSLTADDEALKELRLHSHNDQHQSSIDYVLRIREYNKLISTYLDIKLDRDERIRCSYNLTGTETGRLSSSQTLKGTGTNLQNIPSGDIKRLFVADDGYTLINADLSQAEARVVAYLSSEERLIRIFESGGDIHRKNAALVFNKLEGQVTDEERQLAKGVVHASNYGMGARTFATMAGVTEGRAKQLLNQYFAAYPRIKYWQTQIQDTLRRTRTLTTPFGRKRTFYNEWSEAIKKEGLAYIPQSTVADLVNQALIDIHKSKYAWLDILLQVHDSLVFQCKDDYVDQAVIMIKAAMTRPLLIHRRELVIPVDVKVGPNWEDLVKYVVPTC